MVQLANDYSTTLASGYTAGSGSISVTSATGAPSSGNFWLLIRDQTTKAFKLLVKVTAVSGTTFTVTAESTDVNANSGDLVDGTMFTVASVKDMLADMNQIGTISQRPSAPYKGTIFTASDSIYDYARYNGSSYDQFCSGMLCSVPGTGSFPTSVTTPNGTEDGFTAANDGLVLSGHAASGDNIVARVQAYPSTPFKQRIRFRFTDDNASFSNAGIIIYDSVSHKAITYGVIDRRGNSDDFVAYSWNTVSTGAASFYISTTNMNLRTTRGALAELILEDDGTNRNLYFCCDGIVANRVRFSHVLNTDFVTPDKIGFFIMCYPQSSAANPNAVMSVYDWQLV